MRFCADGPSIPDDLLTARDDGQVLFFCGAGVSRAKAELPDFYGLADAVVTALRTSPDSPARRLIEAAKGQEQITGIGGLIPADRVFSLLEREFRVSDVRTAVAEALQPIASVDLTAHRTILGLARDPTGVVRLVTTNFDLLFEACDPNLARRAPPHLPDPRRPRDFHGIMHLHGHVTDAYDAAYDDELVLSSADFGRAYLSDGWATLFIRSLIDRYRLVFVGYAADDPPVQYLLEALSRDGERGGGLYAFQAGEDQNAAALWAHKGVHAVAYDPSDGHAQLWRTLEAWSERARDPVAWTRSVLAKAHAGPRELAPFERGQVKHLVSTAQGARAFADAAPSAEWLCCFDVSARYATPLRDRDGGAATDPFEAYGLDDDPTPAATKPDRRFDERKIPQGAWDGLTPTKAELADLAPGQTTSLRGQGALGAPDLVPRLWRLSIWLGQVCDQPVAAWWAAGQSGLHPDTQFRIRRRLQDLPPTPSTVEQAWRHILRAWTAPPRGDLGWMELETEIRRSGWTATTLRAWSELIQPYVKVRRPFAQKEPPDPGSTPTLGDLVDLSIEFPRFERPVPFPDLQLFRAAAELRRALDTGIDLGVAVAGYEGLPIPPIEADPKLGGDGFARTYGIAALFFDYVHVLQELVARDPVAANVEMATWRGDSALFNRLKIWAAGRADFTSPAQAARLLLVLDRDTFWDGYSQRDLLLTLERRWPELPVGLRRQLERRLLAGPRLGRGPPRDRRQRRAHRMLSRLMWLQRRGCAFSNDLAPVLAELRDEAPQWKDAYAESAAGSLEGRSGYVSQDPSTQGLESAAPGEVLALAAQLSRHDLENLVDRVPLAGLAEKRPAKLLRALGLAAAKGEPHPGVWETFLLSSARSKDRARLVWTIGERLLCLPELMFAGMVYSITEWMLRMAASLQTQAPDLFSALWTAVIAVMRDHPETTESSALDTAGHDWATHSLNAPAGKLAQALLKDPGTDASGPPPIFLERANALLALRGSARRDALVIFGHQLRWLYHYQPQWTVDNVLSVLDNDAEDERAFWSGFFWAAQVPGFELYARLKPYLLAMVADTSDASGHLDTLAALLLSGWGAVNEATGEQAVTDDELRQALRIGRDRFRTRVLWQVETWGRETEADWRAKIVRLLREVWPRELAATSPRVSESMLELAASAIAGADFLEIVDAVTPLMTPVPSDALGLFVLGNKEAEGVSQHPLATLQLVFAALPFDASTWPYGADKVVEQLSRLPQTAQDPRTLQLRRRLAAR